MYDQTSKSKQSYPFTAKYRFGIFANQLQSLLRLGFPWIVEDLILRAPELSSNQSVMKKWAPYCDINYHRANMNAVHLTQCSIVPKACQGQMTGLTLFFQGAGVSLEKRSCLQNMVDMSLRCKMPVIAFNQRDVGSSKGYHYSSNSLRKDLEAQAELALSQLSDLRVSGVLTADAKLYVYGLCQGGVLALCSVNSIMDNPNFGKIIVTRTPLSFSEMAAHVPKGDYHVLMPNAYKKLKRSSDFRSVSGMCAYLATLAKKSIVSGLALLLSSMPSRVRGVLFQMIFRFSRWHVDCRDIIQQLISRDKLYAISVSHDEFIDECVDVAHYIKERYPGHGSYCVMDADLNVATANNLTTRLQMSCAPFDSDGGFVDHMERPRSQYPHHQAWSQHLVLDHGDDCLDEYQVISQVIRGSLVA